MADWLDACDPVPARRELHGVNINLLNGLQALVDEDDLPRISRHVWNSVIVEKRYPDRKYVYSRIEGRAVYLHRFILCPPKGLMVDHRNGNTLDNRRANLRLATSVQNSANSNPPRGRSGFRGVKLLRSGRFAATISSGRTGPGEMRNIWLGVYDDAETAARVWDAAARQRYGEFARLNFPGEA